MTTGIRKFNWVAFERLLSDDLRNSDAVRAKFGLDVGLSAGLAIDSNNATHAAYGVLAGLDTAATGVDLNVIVRPGRAIYHGNTSPGTYESKTQWMELLSQATVDLSTYVDPANPRWVCIEIAPGEEVETTSTREILVSTPGEWRVRNITKVYRSSPVISVNAGAAAATPAMPLGISGQIPLAYVYIPAATLTISSDYILLCRPLLNAGSQNSIPSLSGGGVRVASNGATALSLETITRFRGAYAGFEIVADLVSAATSLDLSAAGSPALANGESYPPAPTTAQPLGVYLITAPYPDGYAVNIACRECQARSATFMASVIPSFTAGVAGGLIVASTSVPLLSWDCIGVNAALLVLGVNDPTWNGGPGALWVYQMRCAYVGSVTYSTAYGGLFKQRTLNGADVRFSAVVAIEASSVAAGASSSAVLGSLRNTSPLTISGDSFVFDHVHAFDVLVEYSVAGSNTMTIIVAYDEDDGLQPDAYYRNGSTGAAITHRHMISAMQAESGRFRWTNNNTAGSVTSTFRVRVSGYQDSMLCRK